MFSMFSSNFVVSCVSTGSHGTFYVIIHVWWMLLWHFAAVKGHHKSKVESWLIKEESHLWKYHQLEAHVTSVTVVTSFLPRDFPSQGKSTQGGESWDEWASLLPGLCSAGRPPLLKDCFQGCRRVWP
jgi:hypothetical protein